MTSPARTLPSVRLRPLAEADLRAHADGCDDLVVRWNGGRASSDDEHRSWLRRNERAWQEGAPVVDLAIEDERTGEHVGVVGVQRGLSYLEPGEVNLTYTLYAGHRGRGYATAAVVEAMHLALTGGSVSRFLIRCDPANERSGAVARRLGFTAHGSVTEPDGWTGDRYSWSTDRGLPG